MKALAEPILRQTHRAHIFGSYIVQDSYRRKESEHLHEPTSRTFLHLCMMGVGRNALMLWLRMVIYRNGESVLIQL